jgi:membrane associated rhomboid family serine protease
MFIPLHDINPLKRIETPIVNYGLIFACTAIFIVFQSGFFVEGNRASIAGFAMIPAELRLNVGLRQHFAVVPEPLTAVTYMFLHGG